MSLATPSDGRRRSGSGETQARPGATVKMIDKHALVHYLNEKRRPPSPAPSGSSGVSSSLIGRSSSRIPPAL